ncbi:rhodanese-like domain-containing protein [Mycobacterium sp. NPDC051804]|uniref:rhodanese-like domain-containing protein n=1 Tax=Mycobacterium sp. NPDC051804 TaxID=3364295 RepID=UPI0037993AC9
MTNVELVSLVDEGLGNSAYIVDLGDGRALAVDVSRDLRAVYEVTAKRGLTVAFAADTHLHADFLSGATQLAADQGSTVLASAAGYRQFTHTGLHDGDEVDLGGLRLRALLTPGHTHEHLAFVLLDGERELGVFTGGSLIVGSAARTDLVSEERTEELARAQYASLHRLATMPGYVRVWPTHGAGSFCSAPPGAERTSTIATELATNPLLRAPDEKSFVTQLLESLGSYPPYFRRLGELNRVGPPVLAGEPALRKLSPADVGRAVDSDAAVVIDTRPIDKFAMGHIPGAVSIPLRPVFASWLGWLAPIEQPLIIVRDMGQDPAEIVWQAVKIGYDNIAGELDGGMTSWQSAGNNEARIALLKASEVDGRRVLDIRQRPEYLDGHIPGAMHVELGDVPQRASEIPNEPTVVMCGHGERAMGAASLLKAAGHRDVVVLDGGPQDWVDATDGTLETGA